MNAPLIELAAVSRCYPNGDSEVRALDEVSLRIAQGEFIALLGPSGCGKSTLMNVLGCLDRPSSGVYRVNGQDVSALDADTLASLRRDTFGFVFQRYNLIATASATDNVALPAIYAGLPLATRQAQLGQ